MGVDASVFVVVGFSTDNFKFFDTQTAEKKKCTQGHETDNLKAAYCEACGKPLSRVHSYTPTQEFKAFCRQYCKMNGFTDPEDTNPDAVFEGLREVYYNGDIGLWSESDPGGCDYPEVFGVRIGDTGGLMCGGKGFSISDKMIKDAKAQIIKYKKAMKIDEPIEIYLMTSIG